MRAVTILPRRATAVVATAALLATGLTIAVQAPAQAVTIAVNVNEDIVAATSPDGTCDADPNTAGNQCSLREAIVESHLSPLDDNIRLFTATNVFVLTLGPLTGPTSGPNDMFGRDGDLDVRGNIRILPSPNFPPGIIDATALGDRVFDVIPSNDPTSEQTFALDDVTIIGGTATLADGDANGGAVRMSSGNLSMRRVTFRDNTAGNPTDGIVGRGGAAYLETGRVTSFDGATTPDVTFVGNSAAEGGGIYAPEGDASFTNDVRRQHSRRRGRGRGGARRRHRAPGHLDVRRQHRGRRRRCRERPWHDGPDRSRLDLPAQRRGR